MSSEAVTTRSPIRRAVAGLAAAAAIATLGVGITAAEHGSASGSETSHSALRPAQCWYKGWFLESGVWYYGWFLEDC